MICQHPISRRRVLAASAAGIAIASLPFAAAAQSGTVKFILPNATGSGVDAITRAAQTALGKALNASVVVDNQPGAGGVVGLQALARSAPDGNTLSVVSNNVVIFPSVLKSLPFDMPGDFTPIAIVGATPIPGLYLATGHGTLGWTMAAGTARVMADLISGRQPEISLQGLGMDRYLPGNFGVGSGS